MGVSNSCRNGIKWTQGGIKHHGIPGNISNIGTCSKEAAGYSVAVSGYDGYANTQLNGDGKFYTGSGNVYDAASKCDANNGINGCAGFVINTVDLRFDLITYGYAGTTRASNGENCMYAAYVKKPPPSTDPWPPQTSFCPYGGSNCNAACGEKNLCCQASPTGENLTGYVPPCYIPC